MLIKAVREGFPDTLAELLRFGPNVNAKDADGRSVLGSVFLWQLANEGNHDWRGKIQPSFRNG